MDLYGFIWILYAWDIYIDLSEGYDGFNKDVGFTNFYD